MFVRVHGNPCLSEKDDKYSAIGGWAACYSLNELGGQVVLQQPTGRFDRRKEIQSNYRI